MNSRKSVLSVSNLSFSYPDRYLVLKDLNLEVWPGERVGIIGPNGAGKTTFFMLICGVLKVTSGEIRLFGKPVVPGEFRPEVGMVFQNPDDQLFCPSVRDDVAFGPENLGLPKEEVEARVREAFAVTGIQELGDYPPHHLSGGQKRMAAIAGVLAMRPRLVIYDEPTSNLDIRYRRRLIRFLRSARETMLIASHDLEFILEVCDRVILMDEGRIVADGNPRVIMGDVDLMEAHGLERPHSLVPHVEPHHG
ncbi:energy-coupling factor ABC transporter ATP-binding protein [Calderihabitans maritimus]|uniref:ABC-type cobalt transport system, ATPase component n=1 Tax=Calderihabitans maritimus TaxID=1246530 RepID=A0A1Z5HU83_9FIRM|nr:ABC transporter ATP-binding protein [Calderihabitans maritimus]GAW93099.1 ABC-type cobalt transport system, ATPase component [Calderihabitans maritimus]